MYELLIANKNYSSWSLRPWVLMRALGIPLREQLKPFVAPAGENLAFKTFSPSGRVPVLVDGDLTVWESLAIIEYLAERHPGVWPADARARAWARSASNEMHAGFAALRTTCSMSCGLRVRLASIAPGLARDVARIDELFTEGLARFGGPFLAGDAFTAVDAMFAPVQFRVLTYGLALGEVARAYHHRILALPAMQEWYAAALAEPYREPEHEAEIAAAGGTVVEDLRASVSGS